MDSKKPLVSIIALSYNNSKYIVDSLQSFVNQTYENIEIIIVDDCSTDDSLKKIKAWMAINESNAKIIIHKQNKGICASCNDGLRLSQGKYINIIATDDIMMKRRIEVLVNVFEQVGQNVCAVYSNMIVIDEVGNIVNDSYNEVIGIDDNYINKFNKIIAEKKIVSLIDKNTLPAPAIMYRKKMLIEAGGWDESLYFEDLDMNLKLINKNFLFAYTKKKLTKYRIMAHSVSRQPNPKYINSFLTIISKYKNISLDASTLIDNHVVANALDVYKMDGHNSLKWLIELFRITKNFKYLLYMITCFFNIKYKNVEKIVKCIKN